MHPVTLYGKLARAGSSFPAPGMRFGPFEIDSRTRELRKRGRRIRLQNQPFEVLLILLSRPGELVTREEFHQRLWPADTFIDFDHGLNNAINRLREALCDSADSPIFIETIPKFGYRLIAAVTIENPPARPLGSDDEQGSQTEPFDIDSSTLKERGENVHGTDGPVEAPGGRRPNDGPEVADKPTSLHAPLPEARWRYRTVAIFVSLILIVAAAAALYHRSTAITPIESVAIMPFVNEGGADVQYLADGLTDSLISDLSRVPNLKVISRNSVFLYKGRDVDPALAGAALKAQAVLVGRLRQKGDRLLVRLELVDVRDNHLLWGEQYNRVLADLLQTQVEVSREILTKLRVELNSATARDLDRRQKTSSEAYGLSLKGWFYFRRAGEEDLKAAVSYFHEALESDPKYALAYVGLADSYVDLASSLPPREAMPKAREYALKALELQGAPAEAHVALGLVKLLYDWDWLGAEQEFRYDSQMNPNSVETMGCYLHSADTLGRTSEAFAVLTRHLAKDPMSPLNNLELGCVAYYARRYDIAISQYWKTINLDPDLIMAYPNVGRAYVQKRMYSEAIAELEKGRKLDSGWPLLLSELGYAWAASGKTTAARAILAELKQQALRRYVDPYLLAPIYLQLAEPDEGFKWLEKAYVERSSSMPWLKLEPKFDPVRSDPRYLALLQRVGFNDRNRTFAMVPNRGPMRVPAASVYTESHR